MKCHRVRLCACIFSRMCFVCGRQVRDLSNLMLRYLMLMFQGMSLLLIVKLSMVCLGFLEKLISCDFSRLLLVLRPIAVLPGSYAQIVDAHLQLPGSRQDRRIVRVGEDTGVSVTPWNVGGIEIAQNRGKSRTLRYSCPDFCYRRSVRANSDLERLVS